jgi:simple sugar transport system permease protein
MTVTTTADTSAPATPPTPRRRRGWLDTALLYLLSLLLALIVGAFLIAFADEDVRAAASYFFAQPMDMLTAAWDAVSSAYRALFEGAVVNLSASSFADAIRPLTESLTVSAPLICAGLGVALAFRAGLFNIGAQGQLTMGAIVSAYIGFAWQLPLVVHLVVAIVGGVIAGAVWGGVVGLLKARTGAHEVIVTIMLNYIALYTLQYLLTTEAFQRPGRDDPISPQVADTARMPLLLGSQFRLHLGFLLALGSAVFVWWLLERSTIGFRFRAVGANAAAARTAGIKVERSYVGVMLIAGGLAGLAGVIQVLGTEYSLGGGIAGTIGFDAITVALLGRATPLGVVLAGILMGALRAGGSVMQARTGTPIDIVLVVQSLIVLFIAAPPLVRAVFRIGRVQAGGQAVPSTKGWNG